MTSFLYTEMIENETEYHYAISSFTQFLNNFEVVYLTNLQVRANSLKSQMARWSYGVFLERNNGKDINFETYDRSIQINEEIKELLEANAHTPTKSYLKRIIKLAKILSVLTTRWKGLVIEFNSFLEGKFGEKDAHFQEFEIKFVKDKFILSIPSELDNHANQLQEAKYYIQLKSNEGLIQRVGGFLGWSRRKDKYFIYKGDLSKLKLPLKGIALVNELKRRQNLGVSPTKNILDYANEFSRLYDNVGVFATESIKIYKNLLKADGINPGVVIMYLVGGRIYGKPLNLDSDIDFIFEVERLIDFPSKTRKQANLGRLNHGKQIPEQINQILHKYCRINWCEYKGTFLMDGKVKYDKNCMPIAIS